jgi:hypothetical protein
MFALAFDVTGTNPFHLELEPSIHPFQAVKVLEVSLL